MLSVESMVFSQPQKLSWRQRRSYPGSVPKYVPTLREDPYSQDLLMIWSSDGLDSQHCLMSQDDQPSEYSIARSTNREGGEKHLPHSPVLAAARRNPILGIRLPSPMLRNWTLPMHKAVKAMPHKDCKSRFHKC